MGINHFLNLFVCLSFDLPPLYCLSVCLSTCIILVLPEFLPIYLYVLSITYLATLICLSTLTASPAYLSAFLPTCNELQSPANLPSQMPTSLLAFLTASLSCAHLPAGVTSPLTSLLSPSESLKGVGIRTRHPSPSLLGRPASRETQRGRVCHSFPFSSTLLPWCWVEGGKGMKGEGVGGSPDAKDRFEHPHTKSRNPSPRRHELLGPGYGCLTSYEES